MTINIQIKFPPDISDKAKVNILKQLNDFAERNEEEINKIPEEKREIVMHQILQKILADLGVRSRIIDTQKKNTIKESNAFDLSGIDLCEPF